MRLWPKTKPAPPPRVRWGRGPPVDVCTSFTETHVEFVPRRPVDAWRFNRADAIALAHTIIREFGETLP